MNRVHSLHQKKNMPDYGVKVNVHGSDRFGDWCVEGELRAYNGKPFKNAPPHRFVNKRGEQIKHVEFWSHKD